MRRAKVALHSSLPRIYYGSVILTYLVEQSYSVYELSEERLMTTSPSRPPLLDRSSAPWEPECWKPRDANRDMRYSLSIFTVTRTVTRGLLTLRYHASINVERSTVRQWLKAVTILIS